MLDIITKSSESLYLRSSPSLEENGATKEGNLHLCSDKKAWLIKQVSTSNSVYVTRASNLPEHEAERESDGDHTMSNGQEPEASASNLGITAISKPMSILELYPVPATDHETTISEHLNHLIPTISRATDQSATSQYSLHDLHNHIPAPTSMIRQFLARKCVFELPWSPPQPSASDPFGMKPNSVKTGTGGRAYIPTVKLVLDTWLKINEAATISDTEIAGDLEADMLLDAFPGDDNPPNGSDDVYKAVAKRMFGKDGYLVALGLIINAKEIHAKDKLHVVEMSRWVGNTMLEMYSALDGNGTREKEAFEEQWENAVPAAWVKYCSVEVLASACKVTRDGEGKELVSWQPFVIEAGATSSASEQENSTKPAAAAAPTASTKGKRKWHEKFAAQRNVKR